MQILIIEHTINQSCAKDSTENRFLMKSERDLVGSLLQSSRDTLQLLLCLTYHISNLHILNENLSVCSTPESECVSVNYKINQPLRKSKQICLGKFKVNMKPAFDLKHYWCAHLRLKSSPPLQTQRSWTCRGSCRPLYTSSPDSFLA